MARKFNSSLTLRWSRRQSWWHKRDDQWVHNGMGSHAFLSTQFQSYADVTWSTVLKDLDHPFSQHPRTSIWENPRVADNTNKISALLAKKNTKSDVRYAKGKILLSHQPPSHPSQNLGIQTSMRCYTSCCVISDHSMQRRQTLCRPSWSKQSETVAAHIPNSKIVRLSHHNAPARDANTWAFPFSTEGMNERVIFCVSENHKVLIPELEMAELMRRETCSARVSRKKDS